MHYTTWGDDKDQKAEAFQIMVDGAGAAMNRANASSYSSFRGQRNFEDLTSTLSGKPGLRQSDVDYFRPEDALPTKDKDIIEFCRKAYYRIGLIRNSMDLMGDFACQGIRISHRTPAIESFFKTWFKNVKGKEVSERYCHYLLREANVVVQTMTAKLKQKNLDDFKKAIAEVDLDSIQSSPKVSKKEVPWKYNFLNPVVVDVVGGSLSSMANDKQYYIDTRFTFLGKMQLDMRGDRNLEQKFINNLPKDIKSSIEGTNRVILLDPEKTYVDHYKKDDWDEWAKPIIYSCGRDLILYNKLKLADQTALDGAINKIRVWKLGDIANNILPTPGASAILKSILSSSTGAGTTDVIWGPDIDLIETETDTYRFLGEEKYKPTLMAIYMALGIPPTLTGTYGASGTTNNFMSLKTLTERLNYIRDKLVCFWETQIAIVQKAMGFRHPAEIEFDFMSLDDPNAMLRLLIDMADRNIISEEFVQRYVNAKPVLEKRRLKKEAKKEKVSPFHPVDKDFQFKKLYVQRGKITPSELGIELENPDKEDQEEKDLMMKELENKANPPQNNNPDMVGKRGRPPGSQDELPRQKRQFNPVRKAQIELWANDAQTSIAQILHKPLLSMFSKKNMRSLTAEEKTLAERIKFDVLYSLEPFCDVTEEAVGKVISKSVPSSVTDELILWLTEAVHQAGGNLSIDKIRQLQSSFVAYFKSI